MERHHEFALALAADALHGTDEARSLRHEQLLVVMRVVVRGEHDEDGAVETAVDVVRDYTFKHCALEDTEELPLILIERVRCHWIGLTSRSGLRGRKVPGGIYRSCCWLLGA